MSTHQATVTFSPAGLEVLRQALDARQEIMEIEERMAQLVGEIKLKLDAIPQAVAAIQSTSDEFAADYAGYVAKLDVRDQLDETLLEMRAYGWTKDGVWDFTEDSVYCEAEVSCDALPRFSGRRRLGLDFYNPQTKEVTLYDAVTYNDDPSEDREFGAQMRLTLPTEPVPLSVDIELVGE